MQTNVGATVDTAAEAANEAARNGFFLLVLKNGTSHAVRDYWLADGYLEYVSLDSTRSHIPLEALDLERTVAQNSLVSHKKFPKREKASRLCNGSIHLLR